MKPAVSFLVPRKCFATIFITFFLQQTHKHCQITDWYNFHHFFFLSFFLFFFFLFVCVADKQTLSDHSTYIILWTPCTSYSAGRHSAVTDTQSQNTHTHSSTSGHNARALFENRFRFATVCLSADQVFLTTVRMQMTGYAN